MSDWPTRKTLLKRASDPEDEAAWHEFVEYYQQFIFILLLHLKIPKQECNDITQKVLVRLWKNLPTFDPARAKFRTWLVTIIRNAAATHMKRLATQNSRFKLTEEFSSLILSSQTNELENLYQEEWERYICNRAMKAVKEVFSGKAIEVFDLSLENVPSKEIAKRLQINQQSVINLRNRVKNRLIDEVQRLRTELEP